MARLIPLHDLTQTHDIDLQGAYDPTGATVYASDGGKIGSVKGALVDAATGKLRNLIVDVGGWFSSKQVVVPVGMARFDDDAVYFDGLTKDQVKDMREYRAGEAYGDDAMMSDERVLRGNATVDNDFTVVGQAPTRPVERPVEKVVEKVEMPRAEVPKAPVETKKDDLYQTPNKLRLLEERLVVNKEKFSAGSVEIGKHVETRQEQVNVNLSHEELVVERHPVSDPRPVEGNVTLGSDTQTVRVDLEAERANVNKQAYVTEEISVGERSVSEQQTFTETVGHEVLDINKTGDVQVTGEAGTAGRAAQDGKGLLEKAGDTIDRGVDKLDGKIDRPKNR